MRTRVSGILHNRIGFGCLLAALSIWLDAGSIAQTLPSLKLVRVIPPPAASPAPTPLSQAIFVTAPPGDFERLFVVRQSGQINILNLRTLATALNPVQAVNASPFLDLSTGFNLRAGGEQGLLGMAFDPNYLANGSDGQGKFYLDFTVGGGVWQMGVTHVSQFGADPVNPDHALTTEKLLVMPRPNPSPTVPLTFDHPLSNHNGGWIGFSPRSGDDHNLYIATGDGGNGYDQDPSPAPNPPGHIEPGGNAQNKTTLLGKMLRVHVNPATATYSIPNNNPFINVAGARPEIWAYGLRNPFRDSFDRLTGGMFLGDVGQSTREEIDVQQPINPAGGENYGWRLREGTIQTPTSVGGAKPADNVDPILDYDRSVGGTVIGGVVYRGKQIPGLRGVYVFGDYLAKKIFVLRYNGAAVSGFTDITSQLFPTASADTLNSLSSFGEDANGEIYITDVGNGKVFKIVPVTPDVEITSIAVSMNQHPLLHCVGVPFQTHQVQRTSDITQNNQVFTTIATSPAGADGGFDYEDTSVNTTTSAAVYYRVRYP